MDSQNPYAELVDAVDDDGLDQLSRAVAERRCRDRYGFGTFAEAAELFRPHPPCPKCGSEQVARAGTSANGLRRFMCSSCGKRYNALSGTVLEGMGTDMPTLIEFVRLMRFNVPLDAIAEMCGITHRTAWQWRHRVFAAVDGYQDKIVLRDRVWVDETFVDDTDLSPVRRQEGRGKRQGLSRDLACICVAIDVHKNVAAVHAGNGKPSGARVRAALAHRIAKGSTIVGDKEKAHNALVRAVEGTHEAYKADSRDPVYLERMAMVNNLCSWIKRYLWRFTGMEMKYLQSYLNWYVYLFRVNQAQRKWDPTTRIIRHLFMTNATYTPPKKKASDLNTQK